VIPVAETLEIAHECAFTARNEAPLYSTRIRLAEAEVPRFHVSDFEHWRGRLCRDPSRSFAAVKQELTEEILAHDREAALARVH
jgi:hypothetical protein